MTPDKPSSIYETKPNKPNFMLVVALSGVVLVLVLIVAYFVVSARGKKMLPHGPNPEPNSRLSVPAIVRPGVTARAV